MAGNRAPSRMWTKEDVKKVATLWDTKTGTEICEELQIRPEQLVYIVNQMRKAGFDLPKKHKIGYISNLLNECLLEMKG